MPMEVEIVQSSSSDHKDLVRVVWGLFRHGETMATMELEATNDNATAFVNLILNPASEQGYPILLAYLKGELAGGLWWHPPPVEFSYHTAFVSGATFVFPEFRNMGIGKKLRQHGMAHLKDLGVSEIRGVVDYENLTSQKSLHHFNDRAVGTYRICKL